VFNISKVGKVAGCRITEGKVERGAKVRLIRDNVVIHEGTLSTLKRFKDEVKEVPAGQECGMAFASDTVALPVIPEAEPQARLSGTARINRTTREVPARSAARRRLASLRPG
jgi:translation initiation factor IF-2